MPLTTTELNAAVDTQKARLAYISLHTADPGGTGASEATGGSPAYARQAATFGTTTGGVATAGQVTFDVPSGTYTHFGVWSAATAGTFRGGGSLSPTQTFTAQGQVKVTATLTGTTS